jgi:N-acetylmuramoyl-L-alanine amidase
MSVYRHGDAGPAVGEIRAALVHLGLLPHQSAPPVFDQPTDWAVREFQQNRGLVADGIVGPETWAALQAARLSLGDRLLSLAGRMYAGDDVAALQERLAELGFDTGRVDGVFGHQTEAALKGFQREYGLVSDGVCGPATLRALKQLGRLVTGGRPQVLRESEQLHRSGAALAGKVVVIDPGHGGTDRGAAHHPGHAHDEAALVEDLAARLEGRLTAVGVRVVLTRGADSCPTDEERAALANQVRADVVISLHVDRASSTACQGVATYHYGTGSGSTSTVGERLASLVQREVVARTGLVDCRVHAKTWVLLRRTQMPAVRLELGHLTNAGDAAKLSDPAFRDTVAEAVLVAVQRLYLPADQDPPTGVLRLPDLAHL